METRQKDNITLIHGDCMDYMRSWPDNAFDLAVVDPPYGINIGNGLGNGKKDYKMHKSWQMQAPTKDYFDELFRVSRNQIVWGGNYFTQFLPTSDGWIIWDKKKGSNLPFAEGEMAWCSIKKKLRIFRYCASLRDKDGRIHPTQKPIALYKWILERYAKEGDKILDTHLGSGSSAIAAYDLGFEFTGIEIDETYYNNAYARLNRHTGNSQPTLAI